MFLFGRVKPDMPKVPKIKSLHLFAIYPEKHGGRGWEVDFLPTSEPESFRQVDSITLGLRSKAC